MHALSRERRAVKGFSLLGKGLLGDSLPGRRDYGSFSQEGRSLKKGSLWIGRMKEGILGLGIASSCVSFYMMFIHLQGSR